ncbi:rhodanese-like domain-containing protein [Isoalcanivorax indicus]|uniref:rhodanese-like domain-containing protein n=1 Tax=Isoalcanivorax indicus TaxID=2202653 RepID=UPI000DBA0870|nr:rhodanese-like domain-containing protein [Isoalcanivorax indicus]
MDRIFEFAANHYLLVSAFFLLWTAFFFTESRRGSRPLSPQAATNMVNRQDAVIVDLRDEDDFRKGHIAGSVNVPYGKINDRVSELKGYQDKPVILVCNMGSHASIAGRALKQHGFSDLYRMRGGIQGWRNDNLPVVR